MMSAAKAAPLSFSRLKEAQVVLQGNPEKVRQTLLAKRQGWREENGKLKLELENSAVRLEIEGSTITIRPMKGKWVTVNDFILDVLRRLHDFAGEVTGAPPRPTRVVLLSLAKGEGMRRQMKRHFPSGKVPLLGWMCPWEVRAVKDGTELVLSRGRK